MFVEIIIVINLTDCTNNMGLYKTGVKIVVVRLSIDYQKFSQTTDLSLVVV